MEKISNTEIDNIISLSKSISANTRKGSGNYIEMNPSIARTIHKERLNYKRKLRLEKLEII